MKKLFLLMSLGLFISCSNVQNPDYERNLEITKEWFEIMKTLTTQCLILLMKLNIKALFMAAH